MAYQYTEYPPEPEPQPASSRGTRPPRKRVGVDVLDGPEPKPALPAERRYRFAIPLWFAIIVAVGAVILLLILTGRL
ncbi:MAG TPA: hypothetical protein VMB02_16075 [Candidatus Aquilonibacter sp.]|nr:hypothetical protein [Candidatus Aquilonibacter sp.]